MPPVAQIEIQQQLDSAAIPVQLVPFLDVTPEDLVDSVAVQDVKVMEQPVVEKPVEPIPLPDLEPSPSDVMRQLTGQRVLSAKALEQEVAPEEVAKPVAEPPAQVASVPQVYVEAQRSDNEPPLYPKHEKRLSREGKVTVRVSIDENGSVTGVSVIEESRYQGFNRAAVQAARKWKFTPATRGGVAVDSETDIEIVFRMTDPESRTVL